MILKDIIVGRIAAHVSDSVMPRIGRATYLDLQGIALLNGEGRAVRRLCFVSLPDGENVYDHEDRVRKLCEVLNAGIIATQGGAS